jgi:acetylornithine deacetylase/succinyl-diaminopimelate desuccinylase-like protein
METPLDYLARNEARFIEDLREYVRFPSVSAQPAHAPDVRAAADWLTARCRGLGLETVLHATGGNPVLVARTPRIEGAPTFLVYGHYDVQPPEPFELWTTPPFDPQVRGRSLFGRGTSDNKGQHLAHLNAVEAHLRTGTPLPCNLVFLIEGEEEVGSKALYQFLPEHREELACAGVIISDNGIPGLEHPALTYALRGIGAIEVRIDGPSRDLHSGLFGGTVENPAMALCQLLARMRDDQGRVAVPGFYDDVLPLSDYEREQLARIPTTAEQFRELTGSPALFGEEGFTSEERRTARPTFEINGLTSGYQGEGSKTIIPSWASAKLTLRLVPNQEPGKVIAAVRDHLQRLCPPTVRVTVRHGHGGEPYIVSPDGPLAQGALKALEAGFGHPALLMREGGSIPIVSAFQKVLGADTLLLGMALPDDNAHAPDEKFDLDAYAAGMRTAVHLWPELTRAHAGMKP